MSQQQPRQQSDRDIADAVDGFMQMEARQMTAHSWRVTSWRNGTTTAHKVNLLELECTCEDQQFNNDNNEVCDHIMLANHYADKTMDVGEVLSPDLHRLMQDLQQSVRSIEQRAAVTQANVVAEDSNGDSGDSGASDDSWDGDPVEEFSSLLRDAGLDPDDFDVWVDDQYGSLQVDQDGYLDDDEFSTWVDFSDDLDMSYDGDEDINFLKPDRFPEVFA